MSNQKIEKTKYTKADRKDYTHSVKVVLMDNKSEITTVMTTGKMKSGEVLTVPNIDAHPAWNQNKSTVQINTQNEMVSKYKDRYGSVSFMKGLNKKS